MAFNYLFLDVSGRPTVFIDTPTTGLFVDTAGQPIAFIDTPTYSLFTDTTGRPTALFDTPDKTVFSDTADVPTAFIDTVGRTQTAELQLKFGTVNIESDCSSLTFTDGTGVQPDDPTGYFPESGTGNNPLVNPKRSEVDLWWGWCIYNETGKVLYLPDSQDESFFVPTELKGLYILTLFAVPTGTDYNQFKDSPSLISYAKNTDGWFVVQTGVLVDCAVNDCVNRARWEHVKELMKGGCYDQYKEFYTLINSITQSLRLQKWKEALDSYNIIKAKCASEGCKDCGC